jgi:hypothetical protein
MQNNGRDFHASTSQPKLPPKPTVR